MNFIENMDANGYATFRPYCHDNPLLRDVKIREWSSSSNGILNHYLKKDKPVERSVWQHNLAVAVFSSYEECEADLLKKLVEHSDHLKKLLY